MNSFRWQCAFPALLAGLLVGGLGVVVYHQMADTRARDVDNLLKAKAWILLRLASNGPKIDGLREEGMNIVEQKIILQIFGGEGKLTSASSNLKSPISLSEPTLRKLLSANELIYVIETVKDASGEPIRVVASAATIGPTSRDWVVGRTGMSLRDRDAVLRPVKHCFLATVPLAMVLTFLATWSPWRCWRRRIAAIAEDARAIAGVETHLRRIDVPFDDPALSGLTTSLNQLLDRLEFTREAQHNFVTDAAHELRTPLTILQGEIDVILRKDRPAEQYREILVSNREEIERLGRLVSNLLALARSEAGQGPTGQDVLDLASLTREVSEKLTPLARAKGITLVCEADVPVLISGNAISLEDVVFNLTENAIRYSPREESIHLRVVQADGEIRLEVQDQGRGIPAEEIPRIFDRFYRLNGSRTDAPAGVGLGLAIVKAVVEAHGGRVEVKSQLGQGAVFIVIIPQKLPEDPATAGPERSQ